LAQLGQITLLIVTGAAMISSRAMA
jgi:hypothetical protein